MTKDNQPRQATKEENEDVNKQVRRIVLDQILDEEVPKVQEKSENQLRLEILNVYRQLTENTTVTKNSSQIVLDELKKINDSVSQYRTLVQQLQVGIQELNDVIKTKVDVNDLNAIKTKVDALDSKVIRLEKLC